MEKISSFKTICFYYHPSRADVNNALRCSFISLYNFMFWRLCRWIFSQFLI